MAEVIPQITVDSSKVKDTWVQNEVVTNEVYNAINKAVIDLKNNNNLLDTNSMLFREEYNSSSKDLNSAIHQGIYSFTNSAVNAPSGVNGGNLLVTNTSKTNQGSSIITQIAFCHNGAVYARTKNTSENFTAWNKLAYITDNVASATKATQDSQGQQINTTYVKGVTGSNATLTVTKGNGTTSTITVNNVSHATNSDNATKATQDKNGRDITGYLYKTENLVLNASVDIITNGNIKEILNSFCAKIKNIQGTFSYTENPPTSLKSLKDNKAPNASPAFTGTPTAPTPATSDNSTKIATTAFVKSLFTASKSTNGWWKDGNTGMIWQWGEWEIQSIEASASTSVTFPISFPNKCLFVMPSVYNAAEDQIGYLNVTKTGCLFKKGVNDDTIGRNGLYLVIGY